VYRAPETRDSRGLSEVGRPRRNYDFDALRRAAQPKQQSRHPLCQSRDDQRLRNFAGVLDEKLRDWVEHAVLQGVSPDRRAWNWEINRQGLDLRILRGKSQDGSRENRKKAPGRQETGVRRAGGGTSTGTSS
jgi:hypothetical protein